MCLSTSDSYDTTSLSFLATKYPAQYEYVSIDKLEYNRNFIFTAKVKIYRVDNPTHRDIV